MEITQARVWALLPRHLQKRFTHRIRLPTAAIQSDTAHNHKPQVLLPHNIDDFTKLLGAPGKAGNLQHSNGIPGLRLGEHGLLLALVQTVEFC